MVILEAKLHKNRMSVHKILIFVVKMCNNGLCVLEAKFSCGGHQTFSAGMIMAWGAKGGGQSLIATYPENFVLISQLEVFQEGGGQKVGYLEDVENS